MASRTYSAHSLEAVRLLGSLIKIERIKKKWPESELARRVGISRLTLRKIEKGEPGCEIGSVFEAATLVGVVLFDLETARLKKENQASEEKISLLPKSIRKKKLEVKDDF